jgi:oligopeptide transport system substrate-binding protein
MISWKKLILLTMVSTLLLVLIAGCGSSNKQGSAKVLRYVVGAEPETLDPRKSTGVPEARIQGNLFESLITYDKSGKLVPGAAEKWTVSPDGKVYTFTLRANAKWSNGDPVTAQDFEYTWKKTLSPAFASKYAQQLYFIAGAEAYNTSKGSVDDVGIKALDENTLEVTLADPCPFFPSVIVHHAYYPVNKKVDETNPKWSSDPTTFVSNGPFSMKSWVHQSKIETIKNPNYWDAASIKLNQIDYLLTDNNSTSLSMFDGNQADLVIDNLPPADIKRLLKEGKLQPKPYISNGYYCFNVTKAPFDNLKVRQAFSMAIDRESIVKNLDNGYFPGYAFVPGGITDADAGSDFRKTGGDLIKFDAAEAKKLLADAGYPDGKGLPPISLIYNTNDIHKAVAEMIQEMWKKHLGVNVTLENQEWKVFLSNRQTGNYQIARHGWVGDYEDPLTFLGLFQSANLNNNARYKNAEFDKMLALSYTLQDPKARMKIFHDLEKKAVAEDTIIAPLYFNPQYYLAKANVKDVTLVAVGVPYFKYAYLE